MSVKFIQGSAQSSDNKYVQARCMAQSFTTDVTQWQVVDDEPTVGSNNLVKSGGIFNSQYQRLIEIDGEGNAFKETRIGEFMKDQKVFCKFIPWQTTSSSSGYILRIRELYNGISTDVFIRSAGQEIPTSFEFTAKEGAEYYLGGRADVGSQINGLFTYNYVDKDKFDNLESFVTSNITEINKKILQNLNTLTYNGTYVVIDNDTRTITFDGNIVIVNTQGDSLTLPTNNKSASFTAQSTAFTGTYMGVLVYESGGTVVVKQYNRLSNTDCALIGLKFDKPLGTNTTASTDTKVLNYVSMLPIKFGPTIKEILDDAKYNIVEKRDSIVGLGNNTFAGYKSIGKLTAGQTYYVYVNDFKHTSATSGFLFALAKNHVAFQGTSVGNPIPEYYTFVAEEGAEYGYGGRCDADDSIVVEFLSEKKEPFDIDSAKEVCRNNAFAPILKEITTSYSRNEKLGSFLHITDMHSNLASLKEMVRLKSVLRLSNVALLNSGDNVSGWPRTVENQAVIDEYMSICATNNVYHVVGQHEVGFAPVAEPDHLIGRIKANVYSHQQTFDRYFAPLKNGWGLSSLDKCYYYKDFGNVRLIALYQYNRPEVDDPEDSSYYKYQRALVWYGTEQLQWFADTLGSLSEGQVAIILCHQPTKTITPLSSSKFQSGDYAYAPNNITTDDPITEIINAFNNKTQLVKTYTPTDTSKYLVADGFSESVNIDFSNAEGTIGFMLMGDNHLDAVGKIGNILCLCLTSCGACTDGVVTTNTGYNSDYIINALGVKLSSVELGRVGQQYFCGTFRDIEHFSYNT
jgi:hypothetical protein